MSAPKRITSAIDARLDEVAQLKARTPSFRELQTETGLKEGYLRQLVSAKVLVLTNKAQVQSQNDSATLAAGCIRDPGQENASCSANSLGSAAPKFHD